jgi:hypothetical protein
MNSITPIRLARYTDDRPDTFTLSTSPAPVPMRCLWHDCTQDRTTLFCPRHRSAARRAAIAGTLPTLSELEGLRPSRVRVLTAAVAAPVVLPAPSLPVVKPRTCLWPDCGRSAARRTCCGRCRLRVRRLIQRGLIPADAPLTSEAATAYPALWAQHLACSLIRYQTEGRVFGRAVVDGVVMPKTGACIAEGCDSKERYCRGICHRCYRRARYQGRLAHFPRFVST